MKSPELRVLVVDDSVTYRHIVRRVLAQVPGVEVVGTAANGRIALDKIRTLEPELVTLDVEMPEMSGLEVLSHLANSGHVPGVLMLSALTTAGAESTVKALELGAFDFVVKPNGGDATANQELLRRELAVRIDAFARAREIRHIMSSGRPSGPADSETSVLRTGGVDQPAEKPARPNAAKADVANRMRHVIAAGRKVEAVVIGISTGGPRTLTHMLPQLPADLTVPILIVQHMPPVFTRSLADDLDRRCNLAVSEAVDGEPVEAGRIYIAPGGKQMKVESDSGGRVIRLTDDPPECNCRPSADYLFRSAAEVYGGNVLAVVMTGMGNDGTAGCRLLADLGAAVLAQDKDSCVVYGMPREPIEQGLAEMAGPPDRLAEEIVRRAGKGILKCV